MNIPQLLPNQTYFDQYFKLVYESGTYNLLIGFSGSTPSSSPINFFSQGYSEQEVITFLKWVCDTFGIMPAGVSIPLKNGSGNYVTPFEGLLREIEPLGCIPLHLINTGYPLLIDSFRLVYIQ